MFYKHNIKQGKKILVAFFTLTALYSLSQSNNPSPYCSANYSTGCAERFIAQVTTAGGGTNIAHTSNACGLFTDGYAYYCNHFVGTTAGQAITFTVMVGGATHQYGISAYIDWNGDNVFSTPAEQFALSGLLTMSAPYTFTVTVPPTQANGKYRLRIRLEQWGTANNPCTTFTRGETEDYDIYVGMQPPSPVALTATVSSNSPVCAGDSLLLNVNYTSTLVPTFNWSGPSSFSSTAQNPTITNVSSANAGNYFVSVTSGTCPLTLKTNVVVNALPPLTVTPNYTAVCAGFNSTITASGANSYTWSGTTFTGSVVQPSIAAPSGNYSVVATWTNNSCVSSTAVSISTLAPLSVTVTPSSTVFCKGPVPYSMNFTATSPGVQAFAWAPCSGPMGGYFNLCIGNMVGLGSQNLVVGSVIVFTVTAYTSVCSGAAPFTVSVVASPTIIPVTSSSLICAGNQATLSASGANNYTWNPGGTGSVIAVNPTVTTQYTVTGSDGVCSSNATITQSVQVCASINSKELILNNVEVYPNPFTHELKINSSTLVVVTLTDVAGKILMSKKVSGNSVINTSNYPSGMYFLNLKTEHQTITKKVIKE